jgi:hypothetical protein
MKRCKPSKAREESWRPSLFRPVSGSDSSSLALVGMTILQGVEKGTRYLARAAEIG